MAGKQAIEPIGMASSNKEGMMHVESAAFRQGFRDGLTGQYAPGEKSRFEIAHAITESDIVGVIQNLCEIATEDWLYDALLQHDAGLIAGWIVRSAASWQLETSDI